MGLKEKMLTSKGRRAVIRLIDRIETMKARLKDKNINHPQYSELKTELHDWEKILYLIQHGKPDSIESLLKD